MSDLMKQERINRFLRDLGGFVEKYYSANVTEVSVEPGEISKDDIAGQGEWLKLLIRGDADSLIELWSDSEEVTVCFGPNHWHIDDYSEPCDMTAIYSNAIDSVFEILNDRVATYSCWKEGKCKGGATSSVSSEETVSAQEVRDFFGDVDMIKIKRWGRPLEERRLL